MKMGKTEHRLLTHQTDPPTKTSDDRRDSENPRARVLVVEADRGAAADLSNAIGAAGYAVDVVGSGAEAIRLSRRRVYWVAFVSASLPDMGGMEVIRRLKRREPRTRSIIMAESPGDAARALDLGADSYMIKPADGRLAVALVRRLRAERLREVFALEERMSRYIKDRLAELGHEEEDEVEETEDEDEGKDKDEDHAG